MLVLIAQPIQSVHGVLMTPAEVEMSNSAPDPEPANVAEKTGNVFVRVLKAPFKAIGRLFGAGKDDNKPHRLSQKDVKKFESPGVVKVVDARIAPTPAPDSAAPTTADTPEAQALQRLESGRNFLNKGQLNEAISELSTAASLNPKLSEAQNLLGVAFESKGLRDQAFKSFAAALKINKDDPEALNNMGFVLYKNGDYDQATKYLKRAVQIAPDRQRYWNNLGLVQAQRGKFDDAYKSFARAVGEFEGHMNVATRLQAMGHDKEAIKHLEAARAIQPNVALILVKLTNLYRNIGDTERSDEARRAYETLQSQANAATPKQ
jgi:Tfp pilus assembly protein PilF